MSNIIKRIKIPKKKLKYFFIGGMVYNKDFSFDTGSKSQYPFTSYYVHKIKDKEEKGVLYRAFWYCKLPIICLQFEDVCECIEFSLPAGRKVVPFVGLRKTQNYYEVIFKHFSQIEVKEKKHAWLGRGKTKKIRLEYPEHVEVKIKQYQKKDWKEAVMDFFEGKKIPSRPINVSRGKVKKALMRSYDSELGTFLQLPWKNTTGFALEKCSYSLLGFEAVRLNYFSQLYGETNDEQYKEWARDLEALFTSPRLYINTKYGLVWYNTTHFNGKKLEGFFYLDTGYAGYPGGQGTIAFNIGKYLKEHKNNKLKHLLEQNLDFILNTQNKDGSWKAALHLFPSIDIKRKWNRCEGATGQNIRALLLGYDLFGKDEYKESALKALQYLDEHNIICKNVLRDTWIDEPEGFSAILICHAFMDAYDFFGKEKYLEIAKRYATHMLTWHYWLYDLKGYFHPISESITPRISPYESLLAVNLYHRLYGKIKKPFWKEMADFLFSRVLDVVDKNNGLCEGIFPLYPRGYHVLPMEQTFATTELLHTCFHYPEKGGKKVKNKNIEVEEKANNIIIEDVVEISKDSFGITIDGKPVDILMSNPYGFLEKSKTKVLQVLRELGKFNAIWSISSVIKGLRPPKAELNLKSILPFITNYNIDAGDKEITLYAKLPYHELKIGFYKKDQLYMDVHIDVKGHDLKCDKVIFVCGDKKEDWTLETNWTHGGVFEKTINLSSV